MCRAPEPTDGLARLKDPAVSAGRGRRSWAALCTDFTKRVPWEHATAPYAFFMCVFVPAHVFLCVSLCGLVNVLVCAHVRAHVCKPESMSGVLINSSQPYLLSQDLSLTLAITDFLGWLASKFWGLFLCLPPQSMTITIIGMAYHVWLFTRVLGIKLGI